jgi:arabinan endo-1,5-alpha-L-arabinosidase
VIGPPVRATASVPGVVRRSGAKSIHVAVLVVAIIAAGGMAAGASAARAVLARPVLEKPAGPVWSDHESPDPDVVKFGSTYYAYTTGSTWGNNIGVLESTSPTARWRTVNGLTYGSSALPDPPAWEATYTENAPTVAEIGGRYVMFYDAAERGTSPPLYCLSEAFATRPAGPFTDRSTRPFSPCSTSWNGSIDPDLVAVAGSYWLIWKENDSGPYGSSQLWSEPLDASGTALTGQRHLLLTQSSGTYHWELTMENPALTYAGHRWWLLFSAGRWTTSNYSEAFVNCSGPAGPCGTHPSQILTSYGSVKGPGGASTFEGTGGVWYLAFAAWTHGCGGQASGCDRQMFVTPIEFSPLAISTGSLGQGKVGHRYRWTVIASGGLGTRAWSASGLPVGLRIDAGSAAIVGTPQQAGTSTVRLSVAAAGGGIASRQLSLTISS